MGRKYPQITLITQKKSACTVRTSSRCPPGGARVKSVQSADESRSHRCKSHPIWPHMRTDHRGHIDH